jgi:uncharacterized protein YndB with AHSA1/START domain
MIRQTKSNSPESKSAMKSIIVKILIALAAVLVVFLILVSLQPSDFRVTRSATIPAPPSAVFPHVNDLHNWSAWSPWAKMDPNAKTTFEGPSSGVGAIMRWTSANDEVGEGSMTITESRPNEQVVFRLDFIKPFPGTNTAEFLFMPVNNQTLVTWSMSGKKNFIMKAFGLFINCDKMVGGTFEQGLDNLKSVATVPAP